MSLKVHHLNCGTLCPVAVAPLVCHCLLIETEQGLVLVDTGFGNEDVEKPIERLGSHQRYIGAVLSPKETAHTQIKALGFKPEDVRHIIPTHLDSDHVGGLSDFPWATVHLFKNEFECATSKSPSFITQRRYRPIQWSHRPQWRFYKAEGDSWHGFQAIRTLEGLPPEIALVPLLGHTLGHCGVAVKQESKWLLHAGDAYFFHGEIAEKPHAPFALRFFQGLIAMDNQARLENQKRLRALALKPDSDTLVFSAHDALELKNLQRSALL